MDKNQKGKSGISLEKKPIPFPDRKENNRQQANNKALESGINGDSNLSGKGRNEEQMQSVVKEYDLNISHPEAIVIHCNDPRFQNAFDQFIHNELGLASGQYIPVVIPGAAASFSERETFPKEFKVVSDIISLFLSKHDSIKLIVLINHEDCKKYESMKDIIGNQFLRVAGNMVNRHKIDLGKVAKTLLSLTKGTVNVRLFYAKFANAEHTKAVFEEVSA
ncbi:MAG TPA: hypothetical protein P5548_02470 [Candidatus Moranbacteria bacterium]|nr:hypothetical protein [Candidatus Moranbacteria bacterium]HRZ33732.1 hypothetical protein [Candidatus Moranbacteria bacterium]